MAKKQQFSYTNNSYLIFVDYPNNLYKSFLYKKYTNGWIFSAKSNSSNNLDFINTPEHASFVDGHYAGFETICTFIRNVKLYNIFNFRHNNPHSFYKIMDTLYFCGVTTYADLNTHRHEFSKCINEHGDVEYTDYLEPNFTARRLEISQRDDIVIHRKRSSPSEYNVSYYIISITNEPDNRIYLGEKMFYHYEFDKQDDVLSCQDFYNKYIGNDIFYKCVFN